MSQPAVAPSALRWLAAAAGVCGVLYAAYVGFAWSRYGRPRKTAEQSDALLDQFMPEYEVFERHSVRVNAPAEIALHAAEEIDLQQSPIVAAIFRARELFLGARSSHRRTSRGLAAEVQASGWRVLAEVPGREIVFGTVTQPWIANVTFRSVGPAEFRAFHGPSLVKIVWTLRADPIAEGKCLFRTETRAAATDESARARFRPYWSLFSPGIVLIRKLLLGSVKREAERRYAAVMRAFG